MGDLAAVNEALSDAGRPWLIFSDSSGPVAYLPPQRPPVRAYLPPSIVTSRLIRGEQRTMREASPRKWIVVQTSMYAQTAEDGSTFDYVDSSRRGRIPFTVSGAFEDAEILSITTFIRELQTSPPLQRAFTGVNPDVPIRSIARVSDSTVKVDLSENDWSALSLMLRRVGETWTVVESHSWVA